MTTQTEYLFTLPDLNQSTAPGCCTLPAEVLIEDALMRIDGVQGIEFNDGGTIHVLVKQKTVRLERQLTVCLEEFGLEGFENPVETSNFRGQQEESHA